MPQTAKKFSFESFEIDRASSAVNFSYSCETAEGLHEEYQERLTFPVSSAAWDQILPQTLEACLQSLHLVLGLSYWKMHCAPQIEIKNFSLSPEQADFWTTLYTKGLGEFFYRNQIDFRGLVKFPRADVLASGMKAAEVKNRSRCLVPLGGGKDSLVTLEMLREQGFDFDLFTLGNSKIQTETAQAAAKTVLEVKRVLDPRMLERSKSGEAWNGHIPISAIYFFTGALLGLLDGYRYVIFSNERSANYGNVEYLGEMINHQWSKTAEFEKMAQDYLARFVSREIVPFSLLRPLSEIAVVERFTHLPQYFKVFSSCNRNFTVATPQPAADCGAYWCGACPKCAFVFALLAAFLPRADVIGIFGKDLFSDEALVPLYRDLLGQGEMKPFECVGAPEETALALHRARASGYQGAVLDYFAQEVESAFDYAALEKELFATGDASLMPEELKKIFV